MGCKKCMGLKPGEKIDTVSLIKRVKEKFSQTEIEAEIKRMGYMGDGSLDDAGCVELAMMNLDRMR